MKKTVFFLGCLLCSLIVLQAQPTFLGLTEQGSGYGSISKYDATNNTISLGHTFELKAANPNGKMIMGTDGKFYGMTTAGGTSNYGVIYSFDPLTSMYSVVKHFNNTDGANPYGSLAQASDGKLYGMTSGGGTANGGVIFSFNAATSNYIVLKNFNNTDGQHPHGSLIQASDGKLYGLTSGGTGAGVLFSFDPLTSIYTKLKSFLDSDGAEPYGSLIQATDGKLYGMTSKGGGAYNAGVIFSFDIVTLSYTVRKVFTYYHGISPYGSLMQASDGKLYGLTKAGGTSNAGVIFYFNPSTSDFAVVKNFNNTDGANPYGSLIQASNNKLYGMTNAGGVSYTDYSKPGYGVIFSFDASTANYTVLRNFDSTNGSSPYFNDLQANSDGKLYGATSAGSINNSGVIFSFNPTTSVYNKLQDVSDINASSPQGTLCKASNGKYYGMTHNGGASNAGVIFSFDLSNSTYAVVKNFDLINGGKPFGSLLKAANGKLYGMTTEGGATGYGVIFSFDPATSDYTVLKSFNNTDGANPYGSLMQASDGKLYGMTSQGGNTVTNYSSGYGVIFSFDPANSNYTVVKNFDLNEGANPYGSLMQASNGKLYGMTSQGGPSFNPYIYLPPGGFYPPPVPETLGVIFSFDPTTSTYSVVKNFSTSEGIHPYGSLIQTTDGKLYGMTYQGGPSWSMQYMIDPQTNLIMDVHIYPGTGVLFSIDPTTYAYTISRSFFYNDGANPYGSVIQASDNKIYGMTSTGGASDAGVVFSFDPATSTYNKKDFDKKNGASPHFSDLLEIKTVQLNCVTDTTVNANVASCVALVNNIDPKISPPGSAVTYNLTGATTASGTGSASGLQFNVGTTTVTYTATEDPSKICSFTVTVNPTSVFYRDADVDGYGNVGEKIKACTQPAGYVTDSTDCNDNDASVHLAITYYRDADNDGFGDASSSSTLCQLTPPSGYVTNNSDCDDTQKLYQDADGDGYGSTILVTCGGVINNTDCNDNNPAIHAPVTYYQDSDNDGYGNILNTVTACSTVPPTGYVINSTDCDDSKASTHPGATEICNNGIDDNCNGQIDEGCTVGMPSISINDVASYESTRVAVLTVSLSNLSTSDITIAYSTTDGTATSSGPRGKKGVVADYVAASGNMIVPAGSLSATIRITVNADNVVEPAENFTVKLSLNKANAKKATISDGTGVVTILDGLENGLTQTIKDITGSNQEFTVKASPNPSTTFFTLITEGNTSQPVSVVVYDVLGRSIETKYGLPANKSISFGHSYKPGLYYVQIMQGNQKQTLKLIKIFK